MTELTFYIAPLFVGIASGLIRVARPSKTYGIPANDIGPGGINFHPHGLVAANDTGMRAKKA